MSLFTFRPDPSNPNPLYLQIYEAAVAEIQAGVFKPGEKMPSKRSLAEHLGVSLNTIGSAYNQLLDEGYIQSSARRGYYVSAVAPLPRLQREPSVKELLPESLRNDLKVDEPEDTAKPSSLQIAGEGIQFDLLANTVDFTAFPRSVLRSLYREVLSGSENIFSPG
ncbi:MAG: GntR family transcriptional regulator, partial [Spirochaetaceae bacterium]|nr:GntR family transcriptional regulator [Spirochaetaceae bacterium]